MKPKYALMSSYQKFLYADDNFHYKSHGTLIIGAICYTITDPEWKRYFVNCTTYGHLLLSEIY